MDKPTIDREKSNGNYEFGNCSFIENSENIGKKNKEHTTHILQYDLDGMFIKEWDSVISAINKYSSAIQHCLRNKNKTSCGFIWVHKKNKINNKLTKDTMDYYLTDKKLVSVNQLDLNGVFIKNWKSISDVCSFYKTSPSNINGALNTKQKTAIGYIWTYSNRG